MSINSKSDPNTPHILLVNPWIHDFAAYDVWAKPYGLLSLAAILRDHGVRVTYIDCLDRFHARMPAADPHARHGRGPYLKTPIAKPAALKTIPRTYSRYGILPEWLHDDLSALEFAPDLILVTSLMTYWYPGVFETIAVLKDRFPAVPLVLGGIYARLWTAHARRHSRADQVITDRGDSLLAIVKAYTGYEVAPRFDLLNLDALPPPAFDLQRCINYIPLLTSRGCPFDCAYCASRLLEPALRRQSPQRVLSEIVHWHDRYGVRDFVFYDDALLVGSQQHALPLLEGIIRLQRPLFFHTPNAFHIRAITAETARLMYRAGFHTLRLGLETTDFDSRSELDHKVSEDEFERAVGHLRSAGFSQEQIGAYLLTGLPGQDLKGVQRSIRMVRNQGITPVPAYYTPIPHTPLWEKAVAHSRYDLEADPIFSNNTIMPCQKEEYSWKIMSNLKELARKEPSAQ
ncbi:MAG: B12-binding domain-containing radical SAM protein [Desulfobacteraceae bacterium]|nr:B12-binding domain-containing radical SAM protein [Desulfobacteraceae bacterium]